MTPTEPSGIPSDEELTALETDLDQVDEALAQLDTGDLDAAEAIASGLSTEAADEPTVELTPVADIDTEA